MTQPETTIENEAVLDTEHDVSGTREFIEVSTEIHEAEEGDLLGQFGLSGSLFAAQLINFMIVMLVLWKFAYKPLLKLMQDRTEKIEQGLKHADEMEQRINELENDKEKVMAAARTEAKGIVAEAAEIAEKKRTETVANAKSEVEKVVATGKTQIAAQKEQMMAELKDEISALVVEAAKKVSGSAIDVKKAEANASSAIESASKNL
ncbi:F0F1 ATP synthase subunit B [Candidatus Uhrbacteria bacterium]|nr:F0F1 ATP synthase subunit B [Candidatus Uhrbacteria bacterium]